MIAIRFTSLFASCSTPASASARRLGSKHRVYAGSLSTREPVSPMPGLSFEEMKYARERFELATFGWSPLQS
jgi:hypothetical protein